jgi:hypothetical protein
MPSIDPGWIRAAASSALITRWARVEFNILELVAAIENYLPFMCICNLDVLVLDYLAGLPSQYLEAACHHGVT